MEKIDFHSSAANSRSSHVTCVFHDSSHNNKYDYVTLSVRIITIILFHHKITSLASFLFNSLPSHKPETLLWCSCDFSEHSEHYFSLQPRMYTRIENKTKKKKHLPLFDVKIFTFSNGCAWTQPDFQFQRRVVLKIRHCYYSLISWCYYLYTYYL